MKNKNLGDVWVYYNMNVYIVPSKICVVLTSEKIAIQHAWLTLHSGLQVPEMEGEVGRHGNL